jgi:hypothetical protein
VSSIGKPAADDTPDDDLRILHAMGYAQELSRRLSRFSNVAISFSITHWLRPPPGPAARRSRSARRKSPPQRRRYAGRQRTSAPPVRVAGR